jgi:RNA polymerase-binding protein DksA
MNNAKSRELKAAEKEMLRHILLERRAVLSGDADSIEEEALNRSGNGGSGELSNVPFHMADVGSENYEREFSLGILESEQEELRQIDAALGRLEAGTFGMCEGCHKSIPLARLKAVPYARMCVECKQKQETGGL